MDFKEALACKDDQEVEAHKSILASTLGQRRSGFLQDRSWSLKSVWGGSTDVLANVGIFLKGQIRLFCGFLHSLRLFRFGHSDDNQ